MAQWGNWDVAATLASETLADAWAWVGSSESASGGVALAGSLAMCLIVTMILSRRGRSRI